MIRVKAQQRVRPFLRYFALALAVLPALSFAQNPHIDLTIVENGGVAKMEFDNSACPDRPNQKGCVLVDRGNRSWISWEIDSASWQAGWRITVLRFSPDGTHWGDPAHPLADCTVFDFALTEADRLSGEASTATVTANGKRMRIWDENNNACETWYRLFAENISTGQTANSDPIIRNRGNN